MNLKMQQLYLTLAFVYGDNRDYVDLLDPLIFWDFAPIISIIREKRTRDEIWAAWISEACMTEILEGNYDMEIAMYYRHNAGKELLRMWEECVDQKFKNTRSKLSHEAVKKLDDMYEKIKMRLSGTKDDSIYDESFQFIEMARERKGVRTGIDWLDARIWWLRSGTVTRLNGYANTGKSRFMYRVMVNILKQGKSVHLISLEVPRGMVLINLVWAYYEVDTNDVESGKYDEKVAEFYSKFRDQIWVDDDKMSLDQIESSIISNDKDVIFIDYVQNIRATGKSEYEIMTRIAQDIQKMAITSKKPFFDLSQVSNEWSSYKVGDMIPSKGTGAFVFACDIGLVLYKWDNQWELKLSVAKNKFGNKDIEFILQADMATCTFKKIWDNLFPK